MIVFRQVRSSSRTRSAASTLAERSELLAWCAIARLAVTWWSLPQILRAFDRVPRRLRAHRSLVTWPSDRHVRLAGACLSRSLARSQFLRARGVPHAVVIGTAGGVDDFRAHAWVTPYEIAPDDFVELWRIER